MEEPRRPSKAVASVNVMIRTPKLAVTESMNSVNEVCAGGCRTHSFWYGGEGASRSCRCWTTLSLLERQAMFRRCICAFHIYKLPSGSSIDIVGHCISDRNGLRCRCQFSLKHEPNATVCQCACPGRVGMLPATSWGVPHDALTSC